MKDFLFFATASINSAMRSLCTIWRQSCVSRSLFDGEPDQPDFTHLSRKVKEVIRTAGLRDELSFTSFRHGGFTEGGDAELTDREMLAQGRHTTVKVLPKYTKRTTRQIITGTKKRRAVRTKGGNLSE